MVDEIKESESKNEHQENEDDERKARFRTSEFRYSGFILDNVLHESIRIRKEERREIIHSRILIGLSRKVGTAMFANDRLCLDVLSALGTFFHSFFHDSKGLRVENVFDSAFHDFLRHSEQRREHHAIRTVVFDCFAEEEFRYQPFACHPIRSTFGDQRICRTHRIVLEMRKLMRQYESLRQRAGGRSHDDEGPAADSRCEAVDGFEGVFFDLRTVFPCDAYDVDGVFHWLFETVFLLDVLDDRFCLGLCLGTVSNERFEGEILVDLLFSKSMVDFGSFRFCDKLIEISLRHSCRQSQFLVTFGVRGRGLSIECCAHVRMAYAKTGGNVNKKDSMRLHMGLDLSADVPPDKLGISKFFHSCGLR